MSTSEEQCGNTCVEAIQPSCEQACNQACQNIGESCSQQCSEQCNETSQECINELCSGMIEASCQSICSSENVTCRSENTNMLIIFQIVGSIMTISLFMLFLSLMVLFDPNIPLVVTLVGSCVLMINLTGIRFVPNDKNKYIHLSDSSVIKWKSLLFIHSHHSWIERIRGHEFRFRNKYFCTGCYGMLIGTTIAIVNALYYAVFGLTSQLAFIIPFLIPLCFQPIVYRYIRSRNASTTLRLFSNALLPIGCCLTYILIDHAYHSWIFNFALVIFTVILAILRGYIPSIRTEPLYK